MSSKPVRQAWLAVLDMKWDSLCDYCKYGTSRFTQPEEDDFECECYSEETAFQVPGLEPGTDCWAFQPKMPLAQVKKEQANGPVLL